MSEILREYREKFPEYNDLSDEQLVTGMHSKYQRKVAPDMTLDTFKQSIGYRQGYKVPEMAQTVQAPAQSPMPVPQTGVPQMAQPKSMLDRVNEKLLNMGAGAAERAGDVSGAVLQGTRTLSKPLDEKLNMGLIGFEKGSYMPKYFSPEEVERRNIPNYSDQASESLRDSDFGYIENVGWEDVKQQYNQGISPEFAGTVLEYGIEQGVKSIPDMVAVVASLPTYVVGRAQEIGEVRAQNSGREEATAQDVIEGAVPALGSAIFDRVGIKFMSDAASSLVGKEALEAGMKSAAARVASAGGKALGAEATTEAIQEGIIEYVGERFGTDAAMSFSEAAERGLAGGVAGGVFGGAVGTLGSASREAERAFRIAQDRPDVQTIDAEPSQAVVQATGALSQSIRDTEFGPTDEQALTAFDPNNESSQSIQRRLEAEAPVQADVAPNYTVQSEGFAIDQPVQRQDQSVDFKPQAQATKPILSDSEIIDNDATSPVKAVYRNGELTEAEAAAIARAAPKNGRLQAFALDTIEEGRSPEFTANIIQALKTFKRKEQDLAMISLNDPNMQEAIKMATVAQRKQNEIEKDINSIQDQLQQENVANRPELEQKLNELQKTRLDLQDWSMNKTLYNDIKGESANVEKENVTSMDTMSAEEGLQRLKNASKMPEFSEADKDILEKAFNEQETEIEARKSGKNVVSIDGKPVKNAKIEPEKSRLDIINEIRESNLQNTLTPEVAGKQWSKGISAHANLLHIPYLVEEVFRQNKRNNKISSFDEFQGLITKEQYERIKTDKEFGKKLSSEIQKEINGLKDILDYLYSYSKSGGLKSVDKTPAQPAPESTAKPKLAPEDYSNYTKDPAKPQYHGTSGRIQNIDEYTYSDQNIYGQGLYTTDSQEMAKGYTKKGKGKDPALYKVKFKREPKLYDMEQPLDQDTKQFLESLESEAIDIGLDEANTLREVYDIAREYSASAQISANEVQEAFQGVTDYLESKGFDGLRHVGGRLTGKAPHNVEIIFNPRELIELEEAQESDSKPDSKKSASKSKTGYTVEQDYKEFVDARRNQSLKKKDLVSNLERIIENKDAILAEFNQRSFTKAKLAQIARTPRNDLKKPQLIKAAYRAMLTDNILKDGFVTRYFADDADFEAQVKSMVKAQSDQDIANYYTIQGARQEAYQDAVNASIKSIKNPETLQEFKNFIDMRGKDKLSSEQLARYDELVAESLKPADRGPVVRAQDQKVEYSRAKTTHSKKGHDLWVVSLDSRVNREDYTNLLSKAKSLNGYYSNYAKDGAVPGFQFLSEGEADAFARVLDQENIEISGFAEGKAELIKAKQADKLTEMADKLEEKATESLNQDRQTNTAKRAREAASARDAALKDVAFAQTLRKIAAGVASGNINHLGGITAKTQLENLYSIINLNRPKYDKYRGEIRPELQDFIDKIKIPEITVTYNDATDAVPKLKSKKGFAKLTAKLAEIAKAKNTLPITVDQAKKIQEAKKKGFIGDFEMWYVKDRLDMITRLERIGITTDEQLRVALQELNNLDVKKSSLVDESQEKIRKLEQELIGAKIDGYFPTPPVIVEQMVSMADIGPLDSVLEPSAGKGNIVDTLVSLVPESKLNIKVIEQQSTLRKILELKGYELVGSDFLEHKGEYDKILMNPPFEKFQDIDHVRHAYSLLKPNGTLVAVMGAGVKNSKAKAKDFRDWLDAEGGAMEDLPEGSFKSSERTTGVNTVLVTMSKPDAGILAMGAAPDITKKQYESDDTYRQGYNHLATYTELGLPERQELFAIDNTVYQMPVKPQRGEPIKHRLMTIAGPRLYFGKIKGRSTLGFYRRNNGEIRTRAKEDYEVYAHELAHYLDEYSNISLPNFRRAYKSREFVDQVTALSYTSKTKELAEIEGFAEFVRHWLTNSAEAKSRAPDFYKKFNELLAKDKKLNKRMKSLQLMMHRYYLQGPDKLGQARIGKKDPFTYAFFKYTLRRHSRWRQQMIDRFHAARRIEQDLTGRIGNFAQSAWKQLRLANGGSESIADTILNRGTVNFNAEGDLVRTGKGLHQILQPVKSIKLKPEHKYDTKLDLLLRYFIGLRADELRAQKRERLIPIETSAVWSKLDEDYPVFKQIHKEYQEFNSRNLDFYIASGILSEDSAKAFQEANKNYVPFFRIREALESANETGVSAGFKRLKGGTSNLQDILVNIQEGIESNVRASLTNRAKATLYGFLDNNKDGAFYGTKIGADSRPVKVMQTQMLDKLRKIFSALELNFNDYFAEDSVPDFDMTGDVDPTAEQEAELERDAPAVDDVISDEILTFWQMGIKPQLQESGNLVDSVMINGKPQYYEVQDPMMQEMLLGMNPASYGRFMRSMFMIKNGFTRSITLGVEFMGPNLVRDTLGATILTKGKFIPFVDSFRGMYSFFRQDEMYQRFMQAGGGYSGRIEGVTREGKARGRVRLQEFGVGTPFEKIVSAVDHLGSAFEYGTRIGVFRLAKKEGLTDMDAVFKAREISTDFSVLGASKFWTGFVRTVPFFNAMIQSQDRVFREAFIKKKYDGNPAMFAAKAMAFITLPSVLVWLLNSEDEDYRRIPKAEKRTNWHIPIGDGQFIKIPKPYDVGFIFGTIPEMTLDYIETENGRVYAQGLAWTMIQMYGVDAMPAAATGAWDLIRNKDWTGAPVVPAGMEDVSAIKQYNTNTSETFIQFGQATGMSPIQAEHFFDSHTGYLGGYLMALTDHVLWDEERFGPKPEKTLADSPFLKRFITPEQRGYTSDMEDFFELKDQVDRFVADQRTSLDVRNLIKYKIDNTGEPLNEDDKYFGYTGVEKKNLSALQESMNAVVQKVYGKEGMRTAEIAVRFNPNLTAEEKRKEINRLWKEKADFFATYMKATRKNLEKAKDKAKDAN